MTSSDRTPGEGPELLPPAELLRLRNVLTRPPRPEVRARHLAATVGMARQRTVVSPMGRLAGRTARTAAAMVAALAVTSGLAGAQLLPEPAQRLLSEVTERLNPIDGAPSDDPAPSAPAPSGGGGSTRSGSSSGGSDDDQEVIAPSQDTTTTTGSSSTTTLGTSTTTSAPPGSTTTVPGPSGPGSPDDPGSTTTTTAPSTTTTTEPGSTTTTTEPGATTTTTQPSSSTTTAPPSP